MLTGVCRCVFCGREKTTLEEMNEEQVLTYVRMHTNTAVMTKYKA